MNVLDNKFKEIGTAIGEGYAKQGKSWDEVANMPSSGSGPGKDVMYSSAKTAYDNYMTKNKLAPVSTSSANMIQSPSGSDGGLAASAVGSGSQGLANMFADTRQQVQAGHVQGQQGLAEMLGNYRGMWQPNGGNNYQIVGGVENLI